MIGAYTQNHFVIALSQFMSGFGCNVAMSLCYLISSRFLSEKMSSNSIMIYNIVWGITGATLFLFSTVWNHWSTLLTYWMIIPLVGLFIAGFFIIVEDPVYCFEKKQTERVKGVFGKLAKFNGT